MSFATPPPVDIHTPLFNRFSILNQQPVETEIMEKSHSKDPGDKLPDIELRKAMMKVLKTKMKEKEKQDENHKEITRKAKSRRMRDSLITEFLKPIDKIENKIQAEHLKRISELESRCRRLEKEKTLHQKELDEIWSAHEKPLNQKNKPGYQKKRKQDNPNQLPDEQESRGGALKSIASARKTGRSSRVREGTEKTEATTTASTATTAKCQ